MSRITLNVVNNALQEYNLLLVKGHDYFYYTSATIWGEVREHLIPRVMVNRLNDLTLDQWVNHALEHLTRPD